VVDRQQPGWRGVWGTTYAGNLRLLMNSLTEQQWMVTARNLRARPPMAWWVLREMSEQDLKAVHAYVKSLRPAGERAPQLRATRTEADRSSCAVSTMRCSVNSKGEGVTLWVASCARPAAASAEILEQIHQQQRLSGQVSPRPRAAVHVPALPTVYLCSLRALQRYRSSSPQCGHLIAASWSLDSAKAGLLPAGVSATAMTSPHDLFLHNQPR